MGVSLEFEKYIKSELIFASDVAKKRGRRRDVKFLSEILDHLFWARCSPDRTVDDLLASLMRSYPGLKRDTLEDNFIFFVKNTCRNIFYCNHDRAGWNQTV
jgi:hypothetical protein